MGQARAMARKRSGNPRGRPAVAELGHNVGVRVAEEMWEHARTIAFRERCSVGEVIRRALADYLRRHPIS